MERVQIISLQPKTVTIRRADGSEQEIPGGKVVMLWCERRHLEAHVQGKPAYDVVLNPQYDADTGELVVYGEAAFA